MKRKLWQRRLLCCFLAVAVLLGGLLCCLPVRAGAIVPLGLVQSALASYVTSAGYKMYNDQGTGQDILGSLSDLYQTWLDSPAGAAASQWTLAHIAAIEAVYTDTSGQIVIKKAAADVFQQFADWIQTEYSVPVGSDTPTSVLAPSGAYLTDGEGRYFVIRTCDVPISTNFANYRSSEPLYTFQGNTYYPATRIPSVTYYFAAYVNNGTLYLYRYQTSSEYQNNRFYTVYLDSSDQWKSGVIAVTSAIQPNTWYTTIGGNNSDESYLFPVSSADPRTVDFSELYSEGGVAALGVTLAQAVADVVGQAKEDDAVVIGVGASAAATAQDIADMVAQGVKAQTLNPSVSITAEAVIDTPVQPYPDIDGLGLPSLGAALVSRFPFCVPWDFVDTLKILNADPIPPVFDVTFLPASVAARWGVSGNFTFHVDLTSPEYAKLFVALRWGTLVGFCLGLALLTKRLIWTA